MVSRAVSTHSNNTLPSRTSASAECSCMRLAAKTFAIAPPPRRGRLGLLNRSHSAPASGRRPAPGGRDGRTATASALARASNCAAATASVTPAFASIARSSICAGLMPKRSPAAARYLAADVALRGKHQRLGRNPERHELRFLYPSPAGGRHFTPPARGGVRRKASSPRRRFLRSNAGSRRSAANCACRKAGANKRFPRPRRSCRYIDHRRDAHSIRASGFRGSARCVPDWHKSRPPAAA